MKKTLKKRKISLTAIWIGILSLFTKTMGQDIGVALYGVPGLSYYDQGVYGVPPIESKANLVIKIVQRALIGVVFIIGIINLIKIKKIDDKIQRKKRIRRTIIIMSILVVFLVAVFLIPTLLLK